MIYAAMPKKPAYLSSYGVFPSLNAYVERKKYSHLNDFTEVNPISIDIQVEREHLNLLLPDVFLTANPPSSGITSARLF